MLQRTFWKADLKGRSDSDYSDDNRVKIDPANEGEANLIGSTVETDNPDKDWHLPCIDIDKVPIRIVPSSTPGNCHLYIDKPMRWWQYRDLLNAMVNAGIVEEGYFNASLQREQTFVRKPGVMREIPRDA